eukprot:gene32053-41257_t
MILSVGGRFCGGDADKNTSPSSSADAAPVTGPQYSPSPAHHQQGPNVIETAPTAVDVITNSSMRSDTSGNVTEDPAMGQGAGDAGDGAVSRTDSAVGEFAADSGQSPAGQTPIGPPSTPCQSTAGVSAPPAAAPTLPVPTSSSPLPSPPSTDIPPSPSTNPAIGSHARPDRQDDASPLARSEVRTDGSPVSPSVDSSVLNVECVECSMFNCYGLKEVHQYLNIPFLRLKTKSLEEQLRR